MWGAPQARPSFLSQIRVTHFKSFNGNFQFSAGFQTSTQHYHDLDTSLKKLLNKQRLIDLNKRFMV